MHELSIAQALVEQVEEVAAKAHALSVVRVVIAVGPLSGVDADALSSLFPLVAEGTAAAGAELAVQTVAIRTKCRTCGHEAEADATFAACTQCGSSDAELKAGRELMIQTIELEIDER